MIITPPKENDYPKYYHTYVSKVTTQNLLSALIEEMITLKILVSGLSEEDLNYRYESDKWNIKELIIHMSDTERIFSYRALRFARRDKTPLSGFDQDKYGELMWGTKLPFEHIMSDFEAVRASTVKLYEGFGEEELNASGIASNGHFTVRAQGYVALGHALHHRLIIEDRYLE